MNIIPRNLTTEIEKWIDRREIIAIKGPRQSGKTTLLEIIKEKLIRRNIAPENVVYLTFEDGDILENFSRNPKEYTKSFATGKKNERFYFLIDEFHYAKDGGRKLKLLYDLYKNFKFIITGSSSLELESRTGKYLVGRLFSFNLFQLNFGEFLFPRSQNLMNFHSEKSEAIRRFIETGKSPDFGGPAIYERELSTAFEEFAVYGGYPAAVTAETEETKKIILKNIYDTYVTKDIIGMLLVGDVARFRNVVTLLAARTGGILNCHNLARDCASYFNQIIRYLSILEETFVIRRIKPHSSNKTTELRKSPKIYFVDNGMRNHILKNFTGLDIRPDSGCLAETAVLSGINPSGEAEVKFWRTAAKAEVDFLLAAGPGMMPIEVKFSNMKTPEVSRSLRNFISEYAPARVLVLTKGFIGKTTAGGTEIIFAPIWYL